MKLLMFKRLFNCVPNTITLLNLLSGCMAIVMSFRAYEPVGALTGLQWCYVFIAAAALFDFLDGASARLMHAFSPLGKDLDSLSDLVSFGVAPAMMMLNVIGHHSASCWAPFVALLLPAFGALRLAVFNNDSEQATEFRGLPIPANAIFWIGVSAWITDYGYPGTAVVAVLVVLLSLAMTGRFRMFSLKLKNFRVRENFSRYVIILAAVLFVIQYGLAGLAWTVVLYFLLSFFRRR